MAVARPVRHAEPVRQHARAGAAYVALSIAETVLAAGPPGWRRARLVTKPLLMPLLTARTATGAGGSDVVGVVAAQAFSWGGDVALLKEGHRPLLAGLGSFLAAHLCYIAAFRRRSSAPLLATPGRRRLLALCGVANAGMALAAGRTDRTMAGPVAAYGAALATMVTSAAAVDADRGRGPILAGASLFLLSDTLLGLRLFVVGEESRTLEGAVMATYTAAQWCISAGADS